jgi:hypothetical protein
LREWLRSCSYSRVPSLFFCPSLGFFLPGFRWLPRLDFGYNPLWTYSNILTHSPRGEKARGRPAPEELQLPNGLLPRFPEARSYSVLRPERGMRLEVGGRRRNDKCQLIHYEHGKRTRTRYTNSERRGIRATTPFLSLNIIPMAVYLGLEIALIANRYDKGRNPWAGCSV